MKVNTPVTDQERQMVEGTILVSKTDLKGAITYVNQDFIDISGYSEQELVGVNHNIVRHPDMPEAAFQDLWNTMKQGLPWQGVVKNRCKNGDYYWVCANVIPITENGQALEYMSVRSVPSRRQIEEADTLYRSINAGKASLEPSRLQKIKSAIVNAKLTHTLYAIMAGSLLMQMMLGEWLSGGVTIEQVLISLTFVGVVTALMGWLLKGLIVNPLLVAAEKLQKMSEGDYFDWIEIGRSDEIGELFNTIKSTQVRLGFDVMEKQQITTRALRVKSALDYVNTNVMIADAEMNIIYINGALDKMFRAAEEDIREELPHFDVNTLLGTNIDAFHKNPHHQRRIVEQLSESVTANIILGGHSFRFTANPILNEDGERIGTVAEWADRTQEVLAENEIGDIVSCARHGDLSQRLDLAGKEGFFEHVATQLNGLLEVNEGVVNDTVRIFSALAQGDLKQTIDASYDGAFGKIKTNANETVAKLTTIMTDIRESAGNVKHGANEIAQGNLNLSERTEAQSASLEETAASMEEMTGTVRHNSENSREADELAVETRSLAEKGGDAAGKAVSAMDEINAASRKIADIIGVIDEIAFQTNLLALNAAVEAAHAGDQGRGFAVVASEVRNLAQRSAEAAKEIKGLIEDSVNKVNGGTHLVDASGQTLTEIISSVKKVSDIIAEISSAGIEQTTGIEQVNKAILHIDETTQQNTALVEETAAASESLGEESQKLSELVSFFRFDADSGRPAASITQGAAPAAKEERRSSKRPWSAPDAQAPETAPEQVEEELKTGEWEQF